MEASRWELQAIHLLYPWHRREASRRNCARSRKRPMPNVSLLRLRKPQVLRQTSIGDRPQSTTIHRARLFCAGQRGQNLQIFGPSTQDDFRLERVREGVSELIALRPDVAVLGISITVKQAL